MAEFLVISLDEMTSTTVLGGNVDFDKYAFCVADAQVRVLEPLLGTLLYDKIRLELENNTISGDYETLYNDYIKPIVKFESVATFIEIASYMLDNGGIFKHAPADKQIVESNEVERLAKKYHAMADLHISRFERWICDNPLDEYTSDQDEVIPNKNIKTFAGWRF